MSIYLHYKLDELQRHFNALQRSVSFGSRYDAQQDARIEGLLLENFKLRLTLDALVRQLTAKGLLDEAAFAAAVGEIENLQLAKEPDVIDDEGADEGPPTPELLQLHRAVGEAGTVPRSVGGFPLDLEQPIGEKG